MTKWKELLISLSSDCRFHEPATVFQLDEAERQLAVALPSDLRDILRQTNGVEGEYELGLLCEAARNIEAKFGNQKALDYLVGEKFLNSLEAAETDKDFRVEIPYFVAEIKAIFERWQLAAYLETARESEPFDPELFEPRDPPILGKEEIDTDPDEVEEMRQDDIRQCTRDLLLVERAREWLLEE